jgi:alpha/beta hydrolase family protein DUF900
MTKTKICLRAPLVAGVLIFLAGCTSNSPWRTNLASNAAPTGTNRPDAVIESSADYKLGFVEFDDQGWFWDRRQWDAVQQMIRAEAGLDQSTNGTQGMVMVLFVHGWKNNAATDNDNVAMMRSSLTELSKAEKVQSGVQNRKPRKIVGIYVGWRGLSSKWEPAKEISFYERKNTAEKVGYGAVTELLVRLEDIQKAVNNSRGADVPRTDLIIIGHSFGGELVYSAISQILTERLVNSTEQNRPLQSFGDLVILLNPAFEASLYYNLNELATSITNYPPSQRPVLAIFTSKADWATKIAFPLGRYFSTFFEKYRSDKPQRSANREAVGHFQPFITHDLIYDSKAKSVATDHSTLNTQSQTNELHDQQQMLDSMANIKLLRNQWLTNAVTPVTFSFDDCELQPRDNYRPGDPFLVVSVDKKIIRDHNDIDNPVIINFLREFILFAQADPRERSK